MSYYHESSSFVQGLFALLGAVLAILGGFGAQLYKKHLDRNEEQEMLFHRANELLLKYSAILKASKSPDKEEKVNHIQLDYEAVCIRDEISKLALKLKGRKLRPLALKLTRFSLDHEHRDDKELYELTRDIQLRINKRLIEEYERGQ